MPLVVAGLCQFGVHPASLANGDADAQRGSAESSTSVEIRRVAACARLAQSPWPRIAFERRALLQRLDSARDACNDQPAFLAVLGGLWLEEGDAGQALLWLERSLLLDPEQPAARVDHALALASTGDFTARDELLRLWRGRTDVPALAWARLQATSPVPAAGAQASRWAQFRDVAVLAGYESNLDHSPRLNELTITPPDGPIDLPLDRPLQPRPGAAVNADAAWQLAYSPRGTTVLQAGLQGSARAAPAHPETDWHSLQFAAGVSQQWGAWRAKLQAGITTVGGQLNEPYTLARWSVSLESNGLGCGHRLSLDHETRRQRSTELNDGRSLGGSWNALCPWPWSRSWTVGLALRAAVDRPDSADRPGGTQRQISLGLRAFGPLGNDWRLDANWRLTRSLDDSGYSELLDNNARRWQRPHQLTVEFNRPLTGGPLAGAQALVQVQAVHQRSNLAVFSFSSVAALGGLRWQW